MTSLVDRFRSLGSARQRRILKAGGVVVAALITVTWLWNTPPALLGKADAVGYALCHRISERSFHLGQRALPLCARCSGTYLGALLAIGVFGLAGGRRRGALPRWPLLVVLAGFVALMGVDGVNSYLTLIPGLPHLYSPHNWLRLITGALNGLTLAALVYPIFNQTLWRNWENRPVIGGFRELLGLLGLTALAVAGVLSEQPWILYGLALWSALGVVVVLTMLNTVFLLLALRHENRCTTWREAAWLLAGALTVSVIQIGLLDAARYAVFRSWDGLVLP